MGPHVWLYGTAFSRYEEKFDPKGFSRRQFEKDSTVVFHENVVGTYSKYFPNQQLIDRDEFGNKINVKINSRGFRGKDFELSKPPNVIRIITLGASSTFGYHDQDDQTYPYYMQQMLNEALSVTNLQWNGKPIKAFEVINLGVPHLRAEQIHRLFVNEGLELEPDFVTFYEGINDAAYAEPPNTLTQETKQSIKTIPLANVIFREMRHRSLTVALIGLIISEIKADYSLKEFELFRQGKKKKFLADLQWLYETCHQKGVQLIVANQQTTNMEESRGNLKGLTYAQEQEMVWQKGTTTGKLNGREVAFVVHKELMDAEQEWALANNIPYVDVIKAMDLNRNYLVTWVHLNPVGNQIVASVLSKEIFKQIAGGKLPSPREH